MRRTRRLQDRCQNMIAPGGTFCAKSLAAETKIRTVSGVSHLIVQVSSWVFGLRCLGKVFVLCNKPGCTKAKDQKPKTKQVSFLTSDRYAQRADVAAAVERSQRDRVLAGGQSTEI
jgi:hypothetical protein